MHDDCTTHTAFFDAQYRAVLARLIEALNTVALCETWLAQQDGEDTDHAAAAHARALEIVRAE